MKLKKNERSRSKQINKQDHGGEKVREGKTDNQSAKLKKKKSREKRGGLTSQK